MPTNTITKPPTAELRDNQADSDSLPPYDILDKILQLLIEQDRDIHEIIDMGYDEETVKHIARLLFVSEYKRRQAPLGVKVSNKAFDRERRYPISYKIIN